MNLLRRAVNVGLGRDDQRAGMFYDLGDALGWVGEAQPAFAAFGDAVASAADAGDRSLEWLARIRRSATQMLTDPHAKPTEEFRAELEEATRAFEELGDERGLATVWTVLAEIEWIPCRYERAASAANRALDHARESGDDRLVAGALVPLLGAQMLGPTTPDVGLRTLDGLSDDLSGSRGLESFALAVRGYYRCMEGDFDEARRLIGLADDVAEALGARFAAGANAERLGYVELRAGDGEAAERAFRRNYEILDEMGDEGHKSTGAANLARALYGLGRYDEAERYAEIALSVAAEDDLASQTTGRLAQALVLAARGQFAEAELLAREAVELNAEAEAPNSQGNAWIDLAQVLRMAGKPAEAEQAAREALAFYERKGNLPASESARAFIGELGPSLA